MNPGPTGHIPDALPTELSGLTEFNTNVTNVTMASVLPSDHCYQGTGVNLIQLIAMGDIPILHRLWLYITNQILMMPLDDSQDIRVRVIAHCKSHDILEIKF